MSKEKLPRPKVIRAWYVGSVPFAYLFRTTETRAADSPVSFYLQTPTISRPVASPEDADHVIMGLLTTPPPAPPDGIDRAEWEGCRVVFKVVGVDTQMTSDTAEAANAPQRVIIAA